MSNFLLVIGPRLTEKSSVGGVVVLFEMFLKELKILNVRYKTVDSNVHSYNNILTALISIYTNIFSEINKCNHISIHAQNKDFIVFIPLLVFLKKLLGKELSMRKFAGNFINYYESSNFIVRWLIRYSLKNCNACFFETKYLVNYFKKFNPNTSWFPNVREKQQSLVKNPSSFNRRFIFVGQVKKAKGVLDLVTAFKLLPKSYSLDFFGPLEIEGFEELIKSEGNISYRGSLQPEDVAGIMANYDVLVLISYREGYPGVILEAFSVGLPVIATTLSGVKEIVTDGRSGILVEPGNIEQIVSSIQFFNHDNYNEFSDFALKAFEQFDTKIVTEIFLKEIGVL